MGPASIDIADMCGFTSGFEPTPPLILQIRGWANLSLHVKTHTQFYIEEVVDLRVEESLSLSFHYSDFHSQKKTKSGSRSIFKTVTFKLKNFNMTECNILCIFYSFESNFI